MKKVKLYQDNMGGLMKLLEFDPHELSFMNKEYYFKMLRETLDKETEKMNEIFWKV